MIPRLTGETLRGVWAALILPWTDDDRLDEARFIAEIEAYRDTGIHGVYTGGTTGEFYAQDDETFRRVAEIACRQGHAIGLPAQIGVTALSTRIVRQRVRYAIQQGADGLQIALPFWLELSDDETRDFMRAVADEAGDTPLILYQTMRAKKKLGPAMLARLVQCVPSVIGCKDTGCTLDELREYVAAAPSVAIFGGEHDLVDRIQVGGRGTYSSIVGLNARRVVAMYELALAGQLENAATIQSELRRYTFELLVPMVREGLWDSAVDRIQRVAGGVDVGLHCQGPYRSAVPEHVERLKAWCRVNAPSLLM
jgi:dihydrodipicolinate synthase/N-acetylneuraminate lyase